MTNPFLTRYPRENLTVRTSAVNLFWMLALMVGAGVVLTIASLFDAKLVGAVVFPILFGFVALSLAAILLLTLGQVQWASFLAFFVLLVAVGAISIFSRTGSTEADLTQATALFFLGLIVLPSLGVGGRFASVWVLAGLSAMIWICLVPDTTINSELTLARWNASYKPSTTLVLYLVGALAGTILLIRGHRNLRLIQFDQEIIETTNSMLEETVVERTRALRTILDSSGQGLFTFGSDYVIDPEYSSGCRTIFQEEVGGLEADKLLFPQGADVCKEFRQGLGLYFGGKSKAGVIFDLLEKETFVKGKSLTIEYRELGPGKILCVLTDVTLDRQLAERTRADEARRTLVLKALGNKRYFSGLLADAEALFGILRLYEERPPTSDEIQSLLSSMHTFKGNCGFFGFTLTQEVAHDFEYAINDAMILGESLDFSDLSLDLKRSYYQELNVIIEALGKGWLEEAGGIVIPREVFDKLAKYIGKKYVDETHLIDVLEHFRKMPLKDLFSQFPFLAQSTAEKLGKRIRPMEITGGDIRIVPDRLDGLISACVHIVNNMVDHGIELPYIREAEGKPPEGHLQLNILRETATVVLQFSDDGQGISVQAVEARAKEKGLLAPEAQPSHRDVLHLLFASGFSTRDEATEISGRGIGLGAVRQEAERLGGRIEVQTKMNAGTTFEIILPIGIFANRRASRPAPGPERRKE